MRVRITRISEGADYVVEGAAADPPIAGRAFSVLNMLRERLFVLEDVTDVDFFRFRTKDGDEFVWSRVVGLS
jgi:hypothetical protein